jgi:hypothetical protein
VSEEVLLFSYFKGHGDGLHLAVSSDGYHYHALFDDRVILFPAAGKERIIRDPCLVLGSDDNFHLVWTCGWNEQGIGYATSHDLIHWSEQQFLPVMAHEPNARNCWAPEIFFDGKQKQYIIYWSSTIKGEFPETQPFGDDGYNHRVYYTTTRDFRRFSTTRLLYDPGFNVIDANIVANGDEYLLFMKNETLVPPHKHLRMAKGKSLESFDEAGEPLTPNHYWAEGPTGIRWGQEWLVYFDKYKINEIGLIRSPDLVKWQDASHLLDFPKCAQHGFVTSVAVGRIKHLLEAKLAST